MNEKKGVVWVPKQQKINLPKVEGKSNIQGKKNSRVYKNEKGLDEVKSREKAQRNVQPTQKQPIEPISVNAFDEVAFLEEQYEINSKKNEKINNQIPSVTNPVNSYQFQIHQFQNDIQSVKQSEDDEVFLREREKEVSNKLEQIEKLFKEYQNLEVNRKKQENLETDFRELLKKKEDEVYNLHVQLQQTKELSQKKEEEIQQLKERQQNLLVQISKLQPTFDQVTLWEEKTVELNSLVNQKNEEILNLQIQLEQIKDKVKSLDEIETKNKNILMKKDEEQIYLKKQLQSQVEMLQLQEEKKLKQEEEINYLKIQIQDREEKIRNMQDQIEVLDSTLQKKVNQKSIWLNPFQLFKSNQEQNKENHFLLEREYKDEIIELKNKLEEFKEREQKHKEEMDRLLNEKNSELQKLKLSEKQKDELIMQLQDSLEDNHTEIDSLQEEEDEVKDQQVTFDQSTNFFKNSFFNQQQVSDIFLRNHELPYHISHKSIDIKKET